MNPMVTQGVLQLPLFPQSAPGANPEVGAGKNWRGVSGWGLSRGARQMLSLLRWFAAKFGQIFPTQAKLGGLLKVSIATVKRWLLELKRLGAVYVRKYGRQAAEYELEKAILAQIDAAENERSTSGRRAVCERSVSGLDGPTINASVSVSVPHAACASKKQAEPRTQPERKPPHMEDKFDRALAMLRAQGWK